MRRLSYILILIGVRLVGMAGLMLGLDDLLFGGPGPAPLQRRTARSIQHRQPRRRAGRAEGKSAYKSVRLLPTGCYSLLGHS